RRFDSILTEVLNRIEFHKDLFDKNLWLNLVEELPRINEKVIDNLVTINDKIIINSYENIKKESMEKKPLLEQLPHLKLMKMIYLKIRRPSSYSEKILIKFFEL